jgi:hypothetical protein
MVLRNVGLTPDENLLVDRTITFWLVQSYVRNLAKETTKISIQFGRLTVIETRSWWKRALKGVTVERAWLKVKTIHAA